MGRAGWLLRIGMFLCYFAGGVAIWIDAKFSHEWIARYTLADKLMPDLSLIMAFVVAVVVSAFGAIITAPYSWQILFAQAQKVAGINNPNERGLFMLGYCLLSGFLLLSAAGVYALDLLSTYFATKNFALAIAIVFAGDVCFLLANVLGVMARVSLISAGGSGGRTVDATARRIS
jgi:hypothetical protein